MLSNRSSGDANWHIWCRLCAKVDPQENVVNVFMENDKADSAKDNDDGTDDGTDLSLVASIHKFLGVKIISDDELPKMICRDCFSMVTLLVNFADRVTKVQQMYDVLLNAPTTLLDFHALRLKFGLIDEESVQMLSAVHHVDILEKEAQNEMTELDPLAPPYIGIKVEEETLTEQHFPSDIQKNIIRSEIENDEQTKKSNTSACSKRKLQEKIDNKMGLVLSGKRSCRIRDKNIKNEDYNDTYVAAISNDNDVESDTTKGNISNANSTYTCTKCTRNYKHLYSFNMHIQREHFPCPQCSEVFLKEERLDKHLQLHIPVELRKIFSCTDCETKFSSILALENHVKFYHLNECRYICEQCGKATPTKNMLEQHMLSHTDEKPFECEFCKKTFKDRRSLKKHKMLYHDNKDHICTECGLQLTCAATLKRHSLVHSDELKFKCDYCGRAFKRSKTLKIHLILHTGLKPYSCDFCDRTFANGSNCRTHKKKAHPEKLAEQEAAGEAKKRNKNIPNLKALRAVTQTSNNLVPVVSKSSGNFAYKKKQNPKADDDTQTNMCG